MSRKNEKQERRVKYKGAKRGSTPVFIIGVGEIAYPYLQSEARPSRLAKDGGGDTWR